MFCLVFCVGVGVLHTHPLLFSWVGSKVEYGSHALFWDRDNQRDTTRQFGEGRPPGSGSELHFKLCEGWWKGGC